VLRGASLCRPRAHATATLDTPPQVPHAANGRGTDVHSDARKHHSRAVCCYGRRSNRARGAPPDLRGDPRSRPRCQGGRRMARDRTHRRRRLRRLVLQQQAMTVRCRGIPLHVPGTARCSRRIGQVQGMGTTLAGVPPQHAGGWMGGCHALQSRRGGSAGRAGRGACAATGLLQSVMPAACGFSDSVDVQIGGRSAGAL
jgi:hypothetical protein